MSQADNRRQFTRFSVNVNVDLITQEGIVKSQNTRNIGFGGLFIETQSKLPIGSDCQVMVCLSDSCELIVEAQGHVVRQEEKGLAIQFDHLSNPESFVNLKTLILSTSDDHALVDLEYTFFEKLNG